MRPAILAGGMAIPREYVDVPALSRTLTAKHRPLGSEITTLVQAFEVTDEYMLVPRQFGLTYCKRQRIPFEDNTSEGFPATFPKTPAPRDYQVDIIADIVDQFGSFYDFVFKAHTGWGKTVGTLIAAARLGRTTLIVVDQDNLKDQWIAALDEHFGMTVENGHVGIVQGTQFSYKGKSVVIAMVQTMSQKKYPQEFYDYFGFVAFDEVHTAGAPTFSVVLMDFSAMYRCGVSATPKRTDGLQKLLEYNLGRIRVAAEKEHNESAVYVLTHDTVYSWYGNVSKMVGRIINEVTEDGSRNLQLAETAVSLYETGRDTLILSDRIEQLKHLQSLLYYLGVDMDELGLYTGMDPSFKYAKNPKPARRPNYLEADETDGKFHFTPISLQLIAKRVGSKKLAEVKGSAGILLGTYGKCAKGFDEPRLKAGVDASPRSEVEQIHGRILREVPGEKMPIWVTTEDTNSYRLLYTFVNRIKGYLKSNGRMYRWLTDGDLIECPETEIIDGARERHKALIKMGIETRKDGTHILVSQSSVKKQKAQAVLDTVERIRSRHRVSVTDSSPVARKGK